MSNKDHVISLVKPQVATNEFTKTTNSVADLKCWLGASPRWSGTYDFFGTIIRMQLGGLALGGVLGSQSLCHGISTLLRGRRAYVMVSHFAQTGEMKEIQASVLKT